MLPPGVNNSEEHFSSSPGDQPEIKIGEGLGRTFSKSPPKNRVPITPEFAPLPTEPDSIKMPIRAAKATGMSKKDTTISKQPTALKLSVSEASMNIAKQTRWDQVVATDEECATYLENLDNFVFCAPDVEILREAPGIPLSNGKFLHEAEHAALKFYTRTGFSFVNALLTNQPEALVRAANELNIPLNMAEAEAEILTHCRMMCSAINKLPATNLQKLYRGALLPVEHFQRYCTAFAEKTPIQESQILSTSLDTFAAQRFVAAKKNRVTERYHQEILRAKKNNLPEPVKPELVSVLFVIENEKYAKEITQFAYFDDESEAVFVPGASFKVASIKDKIQDKGEVQAYMITLKRIT